MTNESSGERLLGIVLLINPRGPLEKSNVHPAHHKRLDKFVAEGIAYELRRKERLTRLEIKNQLK